MVTNFSYMQFIGKETLECEYKVASLNMKGTNVTDSYAVELLKTNNFIFNDTIMKNITVYIDYYFRKYFTGFLNIKCHIKNPHLILGVNDYGFVTGIPFKGEMDISNIEKILVDNITNENIISNINKDDLKTLYSIKLIKVDYDGAKDNDYYQKYIIQEKENNSLMNEFYKKHKRTNKLIKKYTTKLVDLVLNEETQKQLLKFIWNRVRKNPMIYYQIKRKIREKDFPLNPDHIDIQNLKNDIYSVYYWITRFKDEMIDFYRFLKPQKPVINGKIYPNSIIAIMEDMIPNWMNHNEDMNLYLIKLEFYPEKIKSLGIEDYYIKYINPFNNSISYCIRELDYQGNPCCSPL